MTMIQTLQMAVESPAEGIRVIRTAGTIDRQAAAGLLRLIDAQIALAATGRTGTAHLIIDLANVNRFEPGGMETLHQHRDAGREHAVTLHLTGGGGRLSLLPVRVRQLLRDFSTFPTTEVAVAELTADRPDDEDPTTAIDPDLLPRQSGPSSPSPVPVRVLTPAALTFPRPTVVR